MDIKQLFSFFETEKDYYHDKQRKINLISCNCNGKNCESILYAINNYYFESQNYYRIKNYSQSIHELKSAFYKTYELDNSTCQNCAKYFRSVLTQSLEDIHEELEDMSTGVFGKKSNSLCFIEAENLLTEFKNKDQCAS